jgi:hypothetical protein
MTNNKNDAVARRQRVAEIVARLLTTAWLQSNQLGDKTGQEPLPETIKPSDACRQSSNGN